MLADLGETLGLTFPEHDETVEHIAEKINVVNTLAESVSDGEEDNEDF